MGSGIRRANLDEKKEVDIRAERSFLFMNWVQEYTKKIVTITFILFVIANLIFLGLGIIQYIQSGGEMSYFNALVTEFHQTFRDVIGGYIIKAAVENAFKIVGSIVEKSLALKLEKNDSIEESEDVAG